MTSKSSFSRGWLTSLRNTRFPGISQTLYSLLIGILISQLAFPPRLASAAPDEPNTLTAENEGELPPAVEFAEALEQGVQPNVEPSPADWDAFHLINQSVVDRRSGQNWGVWDENYGRRLPRVTTGLLERKVTVTSLPGGAGVELSYEGSRYAHQISLRGRTVISWDYDSDVLIMMLDDGSTKVMDMPTLRHFLFKSAIPVFSPGPLMRASGEGTRPNPSSLKILYVVPENYDYSVNGRLVVPRRGVSDVDYLVAVANQKTVDGLAESAEQVRYIPLHPDFEGDRQHLAQGDILLVSGSQAAGNEQVVGIFPRKSLGETMKDQGSIALAQAKLFDRSEIDSLMEMAKDAGEQRSHLEQLLNEPEKAMAYFQQGFIHAFRNIPKDQLLALIAHADAMVKTDETRVKYTPQEWARYSEFLKSVLTRATDSAKVWENVPSSFRSIAFKLSKRVAGYDYGAAFNKLARYCKYASYAAAGAGTAAALDYAAGGPVSVPALKLLAMAQEQLLKFVPILVEPGYMKLLWFRSIPGQLAVPAVILTAFLAATQFSQKGLNQLVMTTGIRAFARIQGNPIRLLSFITGQTHKFQAAKNGEILPLVNPLGEGMETALAGENQRLAQKQLRLALANVAAASVAGMANGVCPGAVWTLSRNLDPSSPVGVGKALEVRDLILDELEQLTPNQWKAIIETTDRAAFNDMVMGYQRRAQEMARQGLRQSWWNKAKQHVSLMIRMKLMRTVAQYSEATFLELADSDTNQQVSVMHNRHSAIDWLFSLFVASHFGKWASGDMAARHAQPEGFLWSSNVVNVENDNQLLIGGTRAAATTHMVFNKEISATNRAHKIPVDFSDKEVVGYLPFLKECGRFFHHLGNIRQNQPGEFYYNTMKKGRVQLAQSTFLIGFVPWLLVPCLIKGDLSPLVSASHWQQAGFMQCMFMARALWAFAWPVGFTATAISNHETEIQGLYEQHKQLRAELYQSCRLGMEEEAEKKLAEFIAQAAKGNLAIPTVPARETNESAVSYGGRLVDFYLEHPRFAKSSTWKIMFPAELFYSAVSTAFATYMYTQNVTNEVRLWGMNWLDWDIVSHIPQGDGIIGVGVKATVYTYAAVGIQRVFNWVWDGQKLARNQLSTRSKLRRQQRNEARLIDIDKQRATFKNDGANDDPARLAELGRQLAELNAETQALESEQAVLGATIEGLMKEGKDLKKHFMGAGQSILDWLPFRVVGSVIKTGVMAVNRVDAEIRLRALQAAYAIQSLQVGRLQAVAIPTEDSLRALSAANEQLAEYETARDVIIGNYQDRTAEVKKLTGWQIVGKAASAMAPAVISAAKRCASAIVDAYSSAPPTLPPR